MLHDIIKAEYVKDYKLSLTFDDGKSGIVDFSEYIQNGGVFGVLADLKRFKAFTINAELGVLTWENKIDVAPEILYSKATGQKLPQWMEQ